MKKKSSSSEGGLFDTPGLAVTSRLIGVDAAKAHFRRALQEISDRYRDRNEGADFALSLVGAEEWLQCVLATPEQLRLLPYRVVDAAAGFYFHVPESVATRQDYYEIIEPEMARRQGRLS